MTNTKKPKPKTTAKPARPAAAPARPPKTPSVPIVVGIGASAGGLEALLLLLGAMPPDTGLAFVHIQHLDPQHKSMMAELAGGVTRMSVVQIADGTPVEPNHVYIGPPDRDVTIEEGVLRLVVPLDPHRGHLPIDVFFRSLAQDQGDRSIAVVLSGTGSDGALGIRAIKGAGGTTVAQEPRTAKYDGMPRAAVATQLIDFVVAPRDVPRVLLGYVQQPYVASREAVATTPAGLLDQVYLMLRENTGHDFSHYKQNTIRRRIERRMAVHQLKRLEDYVRHLQRFPAEVDALFKDLLIGVTNFFRDPDAFHALAEHIVPRLVASSAATGQIRVWVAGCSTGEEAYSLALLLAEHLDRVGQSRKVAIFATDIDPGAIDAARTAVYPESVAADVGTERLARLFTQDDGALRISKRIREMVIFAVQDVLKDPPFSRIDLLACRNLLIYLEPELQRKLMQLFHAVLNPGGFLFLGASETVGEAAELFAPVDKKWKLFEKRSVPTHPIVGVTALHALNEPPVVAQRGHEESHEHPPLAGVADVTARLLLDSYAPPCVVVDERYDVLYLQGRTSRYLELPVGGPQLNLLKMAHGELLREIRAALHKALKEHSEIVRDQIVHEIEGTARLLRLRVRPFRGPRQAEQLVLVAFEDAGPPPASSEGASAGVEVDPRVAELERRLSSMKESLQSTVEEVETSNEELRSTNEELQSANEELQSTNEELETSKEELQSVNEELMTVNAELQKKLEELSQANNDLTNLLNSTEIGTVFLDNELRIKRFTPAVCSLVRLIPSDVGRPIGDIVTQTLADDLPAHAGEVLRTLAHQEAEVRTKDGRWYLRRILPYRTVDNVVDGVVVTFVNITEIREAQRMIQAMLVYVDGIVNAVREPVLLLSKEGRVVQVNKAFYDWFELRREDTLGAGIFEIDGGRWGQPEVRSLIQGVLDGGTPVEGREVSLSLPKTGARRLWLTARRTAFGSKAVAGEEELTVLTVFDPAGAQA